MKAFNGILVALKRPNVGEDYWKLIGHKGKIVSVSPPKGVSEDRVLIQFDQDITALGLVCHNVILNSLWIKVEDIM